MGDPRARLLLTAEDQTAAQFAAVDGRLRSLEQNTGRMASGFNTSINSMGRAAMQLRSVLGMLGLAMSGRVLANWMAKSIEQTDAIGQQREQVEQAQRAFSDWNRATDQLGESMAMGLTPAVYALADAVDWLRKFRGDATPQELMDDRIEETKREISRLEQIIRVREGAWSAISKLGLADFKQQLAQQQQNLAVLTNANAPGEKLEEIDVVAIGRREKPLDPLWREQSEQRRKLAQEDADYSAKLAQDVFEEQQRFAQEELDAEADLRNAVYAERDRLAQQEDEDNARRAEQLGSRLDMVRQSLFTETEAAANAYAERQEILDQALAAKLISEQEHSRASIDNEQQTQDRIAEIRDRERQHEQRLNLARIGSMANLFGGLAAIMAAGGEQSKRQFELSKKLAIAEAMINTYAAVTYALRNPPGPPWSFVQAAAAAAFGFAQVRQIQSMSWSGGGGGAAGGGGGGGIPVASPVTQFDQGRLSGESTGGRGGAVINVTITGIVGRVDGDTAREIGKAIGEEINNNDFEFIDAGSRQALTFRAEGVENEG